MLSLPRVGLPMKRDADHPTMVKFTIKDISALTMISAACANASQAQDIAKIAYSRKSFPEKVFQLLSSTLLELTVLRSFHKQAVQRHEQDRLMGHYMQF